MRLEIFLFGKFEVRRNGELLIWRNAKTQALLKVLASERGRVFSVDELIEYLWPEEEKNIQSTASNLRARVAELRRTLQPGLAHRESSHYIETQRGGYALRSEADCWIDTEEFTRFEEQGRRTQREKQLEEAIALYEKAVALYRGEYLADDRYEDWALHFRERWRERYVELLSELADALAQRGRYREALHTVRRTIEKSPLQEQLYRQWIVYAHCAGEPAEARRAYLRCREVLERELGEHPSSRTEEIYRQLQRGEFTEIQDRYPIVVEPSVTPAPKLHRLPFCGRRREWQQLSSALQKAQEGHGVLVLISGEPGMGKTRLCEEFCAEARERVQALFLTGRCLELKNPLPLHPWLEALQPAVSQISLEKLEHLHRSWLAECAELLPALCNVIPQLPKEVSLPAEHRPYRLFETLFQMLCALARQRAPLLIVLDDLQWADEDSIDLLSYLMDKWTDLPLMILATVRSGARTNDSLWVTLKDHAQRRQWLEEIDLKRLTATDTQELIARLDTKLERVTDATNTAERLHRESAGNPLFLSTILQSLFENGCFIPDGAQWRLQLPAETELPPQVLQLIEHRVARAGPAAQRLLQLIACAVQIELDVLECAWEGTSEELFAHLDDLIAQGILTEHQGRYEFSHDKYREAIYRALEGPRKLWLHRRLAQALESVYTEPTVVGLGARLAEHYERGGQPQRALEWVFKALETYKKCYRNKEGLQLAALRLQQLHTLTKRLSTRERLEKECALLDAQTMFHLNLGNLNEAERSLENLARLAPALRDNAWSAKVHLLRADWYERRGQYREELHEAKKAQELYRQAGKPLEEGRALFEASLAAYYLGNSTVAMDGFLKALQVFETLGEYDDRIGALENLSLIHRREGRLQKAREYLDKALQICLQAKDLDKENDLWYIAGGLDWQTGKYQAALEAFQQALQISEQTGDRYGEAYAMLNLSITYSSLGDCARALDYASRAEGCFMQLENQAGQGTVKRQLGRIHQALNNREQARKYLEEALHISQEVQNPREQGECLRALGRAYLAWGEADRTLEYLQQALALAQQSNSPYPLARVTLVEVLLTLGKTSQAFEHCQQLFESLLTREWGGELVIQAHFQHYRVLKALDRPEAQDALRQAQEEVQKTAAFITDPALRQRFLQIPLHQEILSYTSPR
jgi:DNA-binding SARP family transcriptional activator